MTPGDWGSVVSAIVAFAALIVSWVSIHKTSKFNLRQDEFAATAFELNRLLIEREAQEGRDGRRADLSANLIAVGKSNWRLKVFNRGKGTARNVRLIDLQETDSILSFGDIERKFPLPILEQHQAVEVAALFCFGGPSRAHIKLVWDDDLGDNHEKEVTPSL